MKIHKGTLTLSTAVVVATAGLAIPAFAEETAPPPATGRTLKFGANYPPIELRSNRGIAPHLPWQEQETEKMKRHMDVN